FRLVERYGVGSWGRIASHLNEQMGWPETTGRRKEDCRDRWDNYLDPALVNGPFTDAEEAKLVKAYEEVGPEWRLIAGCLLGRSPNAVKVGRCGKLHSENKYANVT
ncbi:transcription factor Myb14, partial [Volvox carteri f. nagariensis]